MSWRTSLSCGSRWWDGFIHSIIPVCESKRLQRTGVDIFLFSLFAFRNTPQQYDRLLSPAVWTLKTGWPLNYTVSLSITSLYVCIVYSPKHGSLSPAADGRHGIVRVDRVPLACKLVDLPCMIESLKTVDKKTFYKTADVCQVNSCRCNKDNIYGWLLNMIKNNPFFVLLFYCSRIFVDFCSLIIVPSLLDPRVYTRWRPLSSSRGANWQWPQGQEEGQRQGQKICLEPRK